MVPWLNDHDLRTPDLAAFHAAPEAMLQLRGSDSHSHAGELYAPAFRCTVQKRATCTTAFEFLDGFSLAGLWHSRAALS
eukprot:1143930-Pelagomonas_calceolata.AAC.2